MEYSWILYCFNKSLIRKQSVVILVCVHHAGIMVNNSEESVLFVSHKHTMHLISLHNVLNLCDFRCWENSLCSSRPDVAYGMVDEMLLPSLHSPTNVTIG